ncbi:unnamed protein product [Zymoseptoria tritici ST99CH_1A5]|uniref:RNA-directed RNA polymerase n=1 Tax=Zymoseptoria tritici ST99CH_1A5 TaxID=1276529 RepID=A0A1Y6LZP9_ZYMTR|nr:unnamed protein product [Zymoseptoria tritici ST99CH_1A5]
MRIGDLANGLSVACKEKAVTKVDAEEEKTNEKENRIGIEGAKTNSSMDHEEDEKTNRVEAVLDSRDKETRMSTVNEEDDVFGNDIAEEAVGKRTQKAGTCARDVHPHLSHMMERDLDLLNNYLTALLNITFPSTDIQLTTSRGVCASVNTITTTNANTSTDLRTGVGIGKRTFTSFTVSSNLDLNIEEAIAKESAKNKGKSLQDHHKQTQHRQDRQRARGRKAAAIRQKGAMEFQTLITGSGNRQPENGLNGHEPQGTAASPGSGGGERQSTPTRTDSPQNPSRASPMSRMATPPHMRSLSGSSNPAQNTSVHTRSHPVTPPGSGQGTPPGSRSQTPTPVGGAAQWLSVASALAPNSRNQNHNSRNNTPNRNRNNNHNRHNSQRPRSPMNKLELKIDLVGIPLRWTTFDVHQLMMPYGNVSYIALRNPQTLHQKAVVFFRPAPADVSWAGTSIPWNGPNGQVELFRTYNNTDRVTQMYYNPEGSRSYPMNTLLSVKDMKMGVMRSEDEMLVLHSIAAKGTQMMLDLREKTLQLSFAIRTRTTGKDGAPKEVDRSFKISIDMVLLHKMHLVHGSDGCTSLVITTDFPSITTRKTTNIRATHNVKQSEWKEEWSDFRQTDVDQNPMRRSSAIQIRKSGCIIDTGRWRTYKITFAGDVASSEAFLDVLQALRDHNVVLETQEDLTFNEVPPESLWKWQEALAPPKVAGEAVSSLFDMLQSHLAFSVHYQLEVCISVGALHESNIDRAFLQRLSTIETVRAVKMLEKIADEGKRIYKPSDIFSLHNRVSVVEKKRPAYCTKIPAANITPTTIYFATPVLETSNRVVRNYKKYEDRFMRVKFTDEKHKGQLQSQDGQAMNEVFSRIKQAMTHGIRVADRHYEFLAFGNAQFREHGAYFFASTPDLNANMIRQWMGNFTQIKNVAKYISRLGQCYTTTRAIPHSVNVERIPDVERNGYCFTDGVGKISPLLARMVADHFRLDNCPSVYQFRMAGCKGVLAVDPSLKGMTVQIRPSQEKFPAEFHGLEICKMSQFSAANLNVQLILVMSSLGVPDNVFVNKYRDMLADLALAMTDEEMALKLLQKNIDFNQMTIYLATIILDGFMATKDPFTISCLRLWRSWNLKYLKEKARVFVDQGAFVFGVTDETGTLQGQFDGFKTDEGDMAVPPTLPQIFLQIPDPNAKGGYTVIQGPCLFARNPSLHPGDIRMVEAVDVPALHHLKDCVVLPQTGDRDLANMCSGGDLDGDDYLICWDADLFPPVSEWNYPPMDYTAPPPVLSTGPVTVDDMTSFFVNYIKNNKLGQIASHHRFWADKEDDGVKNEKCLQLANLHSLAVDYVKTGVPATLPVELKVKARPHWAEARGQSYTSRKVLGQLYDEVKLDNFQPAWELPFDARILTADTPTPELIAGATEVKAEYDETMRRIMKQYGITNEFEVFTTFVQSHHNDINDYKFYEKIGEVSLNLRDQFKEICYTKAGTDSVQREWSKLKPFLIAMYTVTADQVTAVVASSHETVERGGRQVPKMSLTFATVPLMSFPWIFASELGRIANGRDDPAYHHIGATPRPTLPKKVGKGKQALADLIGEGEVLPDLPHIKVEDRVLGRGQVLDLYHGDQPRAPVDMAMDEEMHALMRETRTGGHVEGVQAHTTGHPQGQPADEATEAPSSPINVQLTTTAPPAAPHAAARTAVPSPENSMPAAAVRAQTLSDPPLSAPEPAATPQAPAQVNNVGEAASGSPQLTMNSTSPAHAQTDVADEEDGEEVELELSLEDNPSRNWMMEEGEESD